MSITARVEPKQRDVEVADAMDGAARCLRAVFEASFEAALRAQEAPRACRAINCLLAMTRLAKPNRLNSCASFFARPL